MKQTADMVWQLAKLLGAWLVITITIIIVAAIMGNAVKEVTVATLKGEIAKLNMRDDISSQERDKMKARIQELEQAVKP